MTAAGLTWGELTDWWSQQPDVSDDDVPRHLYRRLRASLGSEPEHRLFDAYGAWYGRDDAAALPALIPQVYLHYDPYTRRELGVEGGFLKRQRMDFLMLLPNAVRVVIEIDGRHHYATDDGMAAPARYADMVSEDRELRLAGYEVYRFGGHEFVDDSAPILRDFFERLLERHRPK